ncbi:MAG TPA: hypothetical protein VGG45_17580 [Terracidiphilus sp.]|jgi:hypothetical protein
MSAELSKPARVLLFGNDAELLSTRARVLQSAGVIAEIALQVDDFADAASRYDGVVCCYTATEEECKEIIAIAARNQTPLLKVEPLLQPPELIRQVNNLLSQGHLGLSAH